MDFVNAQLGRILLVLAILVTVVSASMNGPQVLPEIDQNALDRPVLVALDKSTLGVASSEVYFAEGPGTKYELEREVFVKQKIVKEYVPVLLELPPAGISRAPQVMPEYGPSLEGSAKMPRYGEEFPPIVPQGNSKSGEPPPRATNPKTP